MNNRQVPKEDAVLVDHAQVYSGGVAESCVGKSCCNSVAPVVHKVQDLVEIFNDLFLVSHNTCLMPGADEPLYQPASFPGERHIIHSRLDYYQSALHEIAHWCIAGCERRLLLDYGYWYKPDGRSPDQQIKFQMVEARPQALEWIFTQAVGQKFRLSRDNLSASTGDLSGPESKIVEYEFERAVVDAARTWVTKPLPQRLGRFLAALESHYSGQVGSVLDPELYGLDALIAC